MADATVTLCYGDHCMDIECDAVKLGVTDDALGEGLAPGWVQFEVGTAFDPGSTPLPYFEDGETAMVREEHVAAIRWRD